MRFIVIEFEREDLGFPDNPELVEKIIKQIEDELTSWLDDLGVKVIASKMFGREFHMSVADLSKIDGYESELLTWADDYFNDFPQFRYVSISVNDGKAILNGGAS